MSPASHAMLRLLERLEKTYVGGSASGDRQMNFLRYLNSLAL